MFRYRVKSVYVILLLLLGLQSFVVQEAKAEEYTNPIVYSDYSDPDVIAAHDGSGFYMTASSFQCTPALPILFSEDLVNWEIVNYAMDTLLPADFYDAVSQHGKGVWAPTMRYHDGKYYIYYGDPDFGIFMVSATDPKGRWSEPVHVHPARGIIDVCPFWDEDGKAYIVFAWAASRSDFNSVLCLWEMTPDGTSLIGKPRIVFDGNDGVNHTCEGPKMYKRDGQYYILCPAGGVDKGWQVAMRSKDIWGPYESKTVLAQGDTDINGPHQGGLVDTPDGKSWFIHFQEKQPWGRILHLQPVAWVDGWPIMGDNGVPVKQHAYPMPKADQHKIATSDDFDHGLPGLQWQWHGNYEPKFGMPLPAGAVRVYGHQLEEGQNLWVVPNMLLQKFHNPGFTATAKVKVTARNEENQSGLIVMGRDYYRVSVQKAGADFDVKLIECKEAESGAHEKQLASATIKATKTFNAGLKPIQECDMWLRLNVSPSGECSFAYSTDGKKFHKLGNPVMAREGKWIGAKMGVYSIGALGTDRGWIDLDTFTVE